MKRETTNNSKHANEGDADLRSSISDLGPQASGARIAMLTAMALTGILAVAVWGEMPSADSEVTHRTGPYRIQNGALDAPDAYDLKVPSQTSFSNGVWTLRRDFTPPPNWSFLPIQGVAPDRLTETRGESDQVWAHWAQRPAWVDIWADVEHELLVEVKSTVNAQEKAGGAGRIEVEAQLLTPQTAAQYPLRCEGNLNPPSGPGGPGGQATTNYWAAVVADIKVDLILKNMSSTVADGASLHDMDETEEESDGAEIRINADFDENNKNAANKPLEDFRPDATAGHRIVGDDPDLLDGTLTIQGYNAQGKWKMIFPDQVKVWRQDEANWIAVTSDAESPTITLPFRLTLKIEGIDGSAATKDIEITAEFTPAGDAVSYADKALVTCVKTEFMLTFDDGPYAETTMPTVNLLANNYVNGTKVKAVFFQIGKDGSERRFGDVFSYEGIDDNKTVTIGVNGAGHVVGNHAEHHNYLDGDTKAIVKAEITGCETWIIWALGSVPEKIFRPPYWADSQDIRDGASELGYQVIWGKSEFGELLPWPLTPSWEQIADNTIDYLKTQWNTRAEPQKKTKPAIIFYHENHGPISTAIDTMVERIRNKGFLLEHFDRNRCDPNKSYYQGP